MKKKLLITLLCGVLCLSITACGANKSADNAEDASSATTTVAAEGKTEIIATLDDKGKEILSKAYTTWIPNPTQNNEEIGHEIELTDKGAIVDGEKYDLLINDYSNDNDSVYQFNIDILPGGAGTCYRLLVVYLPMDGSFSSTEFFMVVTEAEIKGEEITLKDISEVMYMTKNAAEGTSENASDQTDNTDPAPADDQAIVEEIATDAELSESLGETSVTYYKLDKAAYKKGGEKSASELEGSSYVLASNSFYPDHVMGMMGESFPTPFAITEENGQKMIEVTIAEDSILEGMKAGEVKQFPFTITDREIIIDLSGEGQNIQKLTYKAVSSEEFYTGSTAQFYGLFDDM